MSELVYHVASAETHLPKLGYSFPLYNQWDQITAKGKET